MYHKLINYNLDKGEERAWLNHGANAINKEAGRMSGKRGKQILLFLK